MSSTDTTVVLPRVVIDPPSLYPEIPPHLDETVKDDALWLVTRIWPRAIDDPDTITISNGEWNRLRRVLLATAELWEAQQ